MPISSDGTSKMAIEKMLQHTMREFSVTSHAYRPRTFNHCYLISGKLKQWYMSNVNACIKHLLKSKGLCKKTIYMYDQQVLPRVHVQGVKWLVCPSVIVVGTKRARYGLFRHFSELKWQLNYPKPQKNGLDLAKNRSVVATSYNRCLCVCHAYQPQPHS